jgi:hypothetical protein
MKKVVLSLIAAAALSTTVQAASLKGGYGACVSKDLFDQFISASVEKDERAFQYLLKNGCIVTKAGIEVSVLDTTWTGTAKVRAYVGDSAIILWTNTENIQR